MEEAKVIQDTDRLNRLEDKLDRLVELLTKASPVVERRWYTTAEFAEKTGLTQPLISRYCSKGRLKAVRSEARRGPRKEWRIPATEVRRFKEEGLLPGF